jgi:hypothetical protein
MPRYLICDNPRCRFVLDLQVSGKQLRLSRLPLSDCPECGSEWSASCPFCVQPLNLAWRDQRPHCARCDRRFLAERLNSAA